MATETGTSAILWAVWLGKDFMFSCLCHPSCGLWQWCFGVVRLSVHICVLGCTGLLSTSSFMFVQFCRAVCLTLCAFSALMLLIEWQEGHPACKKTEWWGAGMVVWLERGADLHMTQRTPLPLTVSCFSKIQIGFYRAMLCIRGTSHTHIQDILCPSVCLSVRPSVTSRSSTEMAKRRITQTTPHDSPGTLVSWSQRSLRHSTRVTPYGGAKCRWGGSKSATFDK